MQKTENKQKLDLFQFIKISVTILWSDYRRSKSKGKFVSVLNELSITPWKSGFTLYNLNS
jgi:hypothetical protein